VAHGNSLRSLMMMLEDISEEDISHVDLPTGIPRLYHLTAGLQVEKVEYL
jgi:2,3-bisphosphoglycerate-dependent phosphoglycerate mutase